VTSENGATQFDPIVVGAGNAADSVMVPIAHDALGCDAASVDAKVHATGEGVSRYRPPSLEAAAANC
jgi:hypothetical protein